MRSIFALLLAACTPSTTSATDATAPDAPYEGPTLTYTCTLYWDYVGSVPQMSETQSHVFPNDTQGLYAFIAWRNAFVQQCETACGCHCAQHCTSSP